MMDWWSRARRVAVLLMCLVWASPEATPQQRGQSVPWWNRQFGYRVKVTVNSNFYKRSDYLIRLPLNSLHVPTEPSSTNHQPLAEDSLRVVEWEGRIKSAREVPSQLGLGAGGQRALCWQMSGETATLTERVYYVYSDIRAVAPRPEYAPIAGADKPPPGNLVRNPGFEEANPENTSLPLHWKQSGNDVGEVVRTDEFAHSGSFSVEVTNRQGGPTSLGLAQQVEGVKPGTTYLLRGWVKVTEQQSGGAGVTVWYTPGPGQKLPGNNKTQAGGGGVADWVQLVATGVIYHDPDRGASIVVEKTLPGTAGGWVEASCWYGVLTAYFDDLELIERDRDAFAPCFVIAGEVETRPAERRATLILEEGFC
ncbi:MAG: carbohydrate binding domain-containing protein [Armatimonadetes bacterium]|nr:carbohydrate binding domain-containing protein [Armatimonadota bacterium]